MDAATLTPFERNLRANIRNFLMIATTDQLRAELALAHERNDTLRTRFVQELIDEDSD